MKKEYAKHLFFANEAITCTSMYITFNKGVKTAKNPNPIWKSDAEIGTQLKAYMSRMGVFDRLDEIGKIMKTNIERSITVNEAHSDTIQKELVDIVKPLYENKKLDVASNLLTVTGAAVKEHFGKHFHMFGWVVISSYHDPWCFGDEDGEEVTCDKKRRDYMIHNDYWIIS